MNRNVHAEDSSPVCPNCGQLIVLGIDEEKKSDETANCRCCKEPGQLKQSEILIIKTGADNKEQRELHSYFICNNKNCILFEKWFVTRELYNGN